MHHYAITDEGTFFISLVLSALIALHLMTLVALVMRRVPYFPTLLLVSILPIALFVCYFLGIAQQYVFSANEHVGAIGSLLGGTPVYACLGRHWFPEAFSRKAS